jgi:hypothetical protein
MTTTIQLTSTQSEVLRHAIENTADKVTWFPEQLKGGARTKVIQALEHKGLVIGSCDNWQVTDTAYEALGLTRAKTKPSRANSKQARIVEMLRRPEGATIQQLMDATGWQAHTVRGALSGSLKKRMGLAVTSDCEVGQRRIYRIT